MQQVCDTTNEYKLRMWHVYCVTFLIVIVSSGSSPCLQSCVAKSGWQQRWEFREEFREHGQLHRPQLAHDPFFGRIRCVSLSLSVYTDMYIYI